MARANVVVRSVALIAGVVVACHVACGGNPCDDGRTKVCLSDGTTCTCAPSCSSASDCLQYSPCQSPGQCACESSLCVPVHWASGQTIDWGGSGTSSGGGSGSGGGSWGTCQMCNQGYCGISVKPGYNASDTCATACSNAGLAFDHVDSCANCDCVHPYVGSYPSDVWCTSLTPDPIGYPGAYGCYCSGSAGSGQMCGTGSGSGGSSSGGTGSMACVNLTDNCGNGICSCVPPADVPSGYSSSPSCGTFDCCLSYNPPASGGVTCECSSLASAACQYGSALTCQEIAAKAGATLVPSCP